MFIDVQRVRDCLSGLMKPLGREWWSRTDREGTAQYGILRYNELTVYRTLPVYVDF